MGKQKRARQKYHLASIKARENAENESNTIVDLENNYTGLEWHVPAVENIFKGIDIDVNKLKSTLADDAVSVRSVAKSIKTNVGKHLKKNEKRKLRHHLFIQKIDAIYKKLREEKKRGKKTEVDQEMEESVDLELPVINSENEDEKKPKKIMGIKKAKQRKKIMLNDIAAFRKVLSNPDYKMNPLKVISDHVQKLAEESGL